MSRERNPPNGPKRKYWVDVRIAAGFMIATLGVAVFLGATSWDLIGALISIVLWFLYFFIGWVLDGFQFHMLLRHFEGEEDNRKAYSTIKDFAEDRTPFFLLWPITLIYTALYIPLILLVRAM